MGYLTPDVTPDTVVCRALFVPNHPAYLAVVRGALEELTFSYNWQKFGALTPEAAASNFLDMFNRFCFNEGSCRLIGEIIAYAGSTSPNANYLVCDGSEILRASYPDLYTVIGTTYGTSSNPGTLFKLPDLRGRALTGVGTGSGIPSVSLGQKYGTPTHTLTISEIPAHHHYHVYSAMFALINGGLEAPAASANAVDANTADTGGSGAHNNQGPRIGITYLIVAKQ